FVLLIATISGTLRHISRCEASYLIVQGFTKWEIHWRDFRGDDHRGLAHVESVTFYTLLGLASVLPAFIACLMKARHTLAHGIPIILAFIAFSILNVRKERFEKEEQQAKNLWQQVIGRAP